MQPVVSSEQMAWCDRTTITKVGIPGLLLMDRAGTTAAHLIIESFPSIPGAAVVVCGKGNNAGDGFVIARILADHGNRVVVVLTGPASGLRGDAATQYNILRRCSRLPGSSIGFSTLSSFLRKGPKDVSLIIDAVFGTGFKGAPRGTPKRAIEWIRSAGVPVVSVDVPSGIDATTGVASGAHVSADLTITFGLMKSGLLLNDGREHAGHVTCVDIGIPAGIVRMASVAGHVVGREDVRALLPRRPRRLHKYAAGKVLVLAGSRGFTGAANLAAHGALRTGAGAVILMVPEAVYPVLARKRTDEIVIPVPDTPEGSFGEVSLTAVREKLSWADVLLIGPGISLSRETSAFVREVLYDRSGPAVIDADALTIVAKISSLRSLLRSSDWILTPHTGEFDRFVSMGSGEIEKARLQAARTFTLRKACTLVLKGSPTVVSAGKDGCFINPTGNPGMATVGSGDVLSGCIAALRAQGLPSQQAAYAGTYLHGRAGDLASDVLGERSVVASDLLQYLPVALRECSQ